MCAVEQKMRNRGLFTSVLSNRCPRCREGGLFDNANPFDLRTTMRMPEHCPVCGQAFELQTGFYFGTGYVSYFLSVGFCLITAALWFFTIGFAFDDNRIYWYLATVTALLILTQPLNQRLCRSIWIAFFVRYDAQWKAQVAAIGN